MGAAQFLTEIHRLAAEIAEAEALPIGVALTEAAMVYDQIGTYHWDWDADAASAGNPVAAELLGELPF